MMSRLLTILTASGDVVRGHNAGHWRISRPLWTSMASWLGEPMTPTDAGGRVRRASSGSCCGRSARRRRPTSCGGSARRRAPSAPRSSDVEAVAVELEDGSTGWVLPDDTADLEAPAPVEPWVALLPTLDPTTMGWRERAFYLDPAHTPYLFDSRRQRRHDGVGRRADRRVLGAGRATSGSSSSSWRTVSRDARAAARRRGRPPRRVPPRRAHHQRVRLPADEAPTPQLTHRRVHAAPTDVRRRPRERAGRVEDGTDQPAPACDYRIAPYYRYMSSQ